MNERMTPLAHRWPDSLPDHVTDATHDWTKATLDLQVNVTPLLKASVSGPWVYTWGIVYCRVCLSCMYVTAERSYDSVGKYLGACFGFVWKCYVMECTCQWRYVSVSTDQCHVTAGIMVDVIRRTLKTLSVAVPRLNKKAARVEVNISLAFLYWVGIAFHPWPFVPDIAIYLCWKGTLNTN